MEGRKRVTIKELYNRRFVAVGRGEKTLLLVTSS